MTMKRLGRAAAWGTAVVMAAATSGLVWLIFLWASQRGVWFDSVSLAMRVMIVVVLTVVPWATVIASLLIRERTGRRLR